MYGVYDDFLGNPKDTKEGPLFKRPPPKSGPVNHGAVVEKPLPPSNNAAETNELKWSKLLYDYTQNTSLHGIPYITGESWYLLRRLVWMIVVGTALGFFIFYAVDRIRFYLLFTMNVNVEVNYLQKLLFPAVTICNQNAYRLTPVADNGWYDLVKNLYLSGSDTVYRKCYENDEFTCHDKQSSCIDINLRCDMFPDCTDGSDEADCDPCPLIQLNGPAGLLPDVINHQYVIQPNTYNSTAPVYILVGATLAFLFEESGTWYLADQYSTDTTDGVTIYGQIVDSAGTPDKIGGGNATWQILDNGTLTDIPDISINCTNSYWNLLQNGGVTSIPGLTLQTLTDVASHQLDEFVQSCKWKGVPCADHWITEKPTDMGKCFTFYADDMNIEQAGPGYGLSLTVNIEFYEYTKSADAGLGVKLLMHEKGDVPMVAGQGTSVSPGLYSFISVDTTQVSNQPPPWGECGPVPLDYYNDYSVARCTLECEMEFVVDDWGCGCRNMHMPEKGSQPPVCSVDKFVDCLSPGIDYLRAAGNYCTCTTPCTTNTYVPTTSFSIVLSPENSETAIDQESAVLKDKLHRARETRYRVVHEKKLETMRNFHVLIQQLLWFVRYVQASNRYMAFENEQIKSHYYQARSDCIWIRDTLMTAKTEIEDKIMTPLTDYKSILMSRGVQPLIEVRDLVSDSISRVDYINWNGSAAYEEEMLNLVSANNDTTWHYYARLRQAFEQLAGTLRSDAYAMANSISAMSHFRLKDTYITPLLPVIGPHCSWCVDAADSPFIDIVKIRILDYIDNTLQNEINSADSRLNSAYNNHLKDLWISNVTEDVTNGDRNSYYNKINAAVNDMDDALTLVQNALDDAAESLRMIEDLLTFHREKCAVQLPKLVDEYDDIHDVITELYNEMNVYTSKQGEDIASWKTQYDALNMTLEAIGKTIAFDGIRSVVGDNKVRLEAALNERMNGIKNIHSTIDQTNYAFMSVITSARLASQSAYWVSFGITSPSVTLPSTNTEAVNSVTVPYRDYRMEPGSGVDDYWANFVATLQMVKSNLQEHVSDMTEALKTSEAFFSDYVTGNQLNSNFYSNNFLQIELFYKELTERKVSQQKAYEYPNLLSELGGFMGLLLGASVLSLAEIADLFLYNACRKCLKKKPAKTTPAWQKQ